jgi:hypothetical protein
MTRHLCALTVLAFSTSFTPAHAVLEAYTDTALSGINAQAYTVIPLETGASITLGIDFRLNLDPDGYGGAAVDGKLENVCNSSASVVACNIGVAFNNRFTNVSGVLRKDWLVFKNVTGSISIPEVIISGQEVYTDVAGTIRKPALNLKFDGTKPIIIKQLGFESLAVETDSAAEVDGSGNLNPSNLAGYRVATLSPSATANGDTNNFDAGKATGFIGLDMTAKIAINGNIKIFSCTRSATGCS